MAENFADLLNGIVAEQTSGQEDVGLFLSGGVDSLSLGFAASRIGKTVFAYTFQVGEWESSDSLSARKAAKEMGWRFKLVKLPLDHLERDFIALADRWGCKKKTQFECTWPFLYLVPEIEQECVLSGVAADGHYGLSKKAILHHIATKDAFDAFRRDYFGGANPAGVVQQRAIVEHYGKRLAAPYLDRRVFDFMIKLDWSEINEPMQKMPVLNAYRNEFARVAVRKHANLQLVAGVDHVFEQLLQTGLNKNGRKRVMDLCRDYAHEHEKTKA